MVNWQSSIFDFGVRTGEGGGTRQGLAPRESGAEERNNKWAVEKGASQTSAVQDEATKEQGGEWRRWANRVWGQQGEWDSAATKTDVDDGRRGCCRSAGLMNSLTARFCTTTPYAVRTSFRLQASCFMLQQPHPSWRWRQPLWDHFAVLDS
jgi:hypothetical protein